MTPLRFAHVEALDVRLGGRNDMLGGHKRALETGRNRLLVTGVVFALAFSAIGARLVDLTVLSRATPRIAKETAPAALTRARADIVDRNGVVLATSLPTASLYADPEEVLDAEEAATKLARVLPDADPKQLHARLSAKGRFVWLRRNLTPRQKDEVNRLGIPGLAFQDESRRVYPHGQAGAHVLGLTDVDGHGIAGVERYFDEVLRGGGEPLSLSLDLRVQAVVRREIEAAVNEFDAIGAAGVVQDVETGEIIAMVSLPDFDPNNPEEATEARAFNRVTKGVYEMGSTFKLFTIATALDTGTVSLHGGYDASQPIKISRFVISDYHPENRWLSVPEILVYSSNIGAAKMAMDTGTKAQRDYLKRFGLLDAAAVELPEVGSPLTPQHWREINTMTISYGHGIAVSPVQMVDAVATLVNGGIRNPATIVKLPEGVRTEGKRVVLAETSRKMRTLMRMVVEKGTGKKADAEGYRVGGKTGTAEKNAAGGYKRRALMSSFIGAFPIDAPRYVVFVVLDEPKGNKQTRNFATGGWVAAPSVGRLVADIAPLLGIPPVLEDAGGNERKEEAKRPEARPASPPMTMERLLISLTAEGQGAGDHKGEAH